MGDLNSSGSDHEEEGESKTDNSMVTMSGTSAVQKQSLEDALPININCQKISTVVEQGRFLK